MKVITKKMIDCKEVSLVRTYYPVEIYMDSDDNYYYTLYDNVISIVNNRKNKLEFLDNNEA